MSRAGTLGSNIVGPRANRALGPTHHPRETVGYEARTMPVKALTDGYLPNLRSAHSGAMGLAYADD